jgi:hypothetical protein
MRARGAPPAMNTMRSAGPIAIATAVCWLSACAAGSSTSLAGVDDEPSAPAIDSLRPWPGASGATVADVADALDGDVSGLVWDVGASSVASPVASPVIWAVQNNPGRLYRLTHDGQNWGPDTASTWREGVDLRYPGGVGYPDAEGVTLVAAGDAAGSTRVFYVAAERNNGAREASRNTVLRFVLHDGLSSDSSDGDDSASGRPVWSADALWELNELLPRTGANEGIEAIAWVPDSVLTRAGLVDRETGGGYTPARFGSHDDGVVFVGVEATGSVHGFVLDLDSGEAHEITRFETGLDHVMGLEFDAATGQLWASCDDSCGVQLAVFGVEAATASPHVGQFVRRGWYRSPEGLADLNLEGLAIAPASRCTGSPARRDVLWSDDGATGGHVLWKGWLDC